MEDLWKLRDLGYRLKDVDMSDQAEYDRLVKRFQEEEKANLKNLLYGEEPASRPHPVLKPSNAKGKK